MTYSSPESFKDLKKVKIKNYYVDKNPGEIAVEAVFLGQLELLGYYNRVGAKMRILSAAIQTFWSCGALILLGYIFGLEDPQKTPVHALALVAAIFGTAFFREMKDIHGKWDYLAKTFNDIIKIPLATGEYNAREHLSACLAHDILTMNMWAHRSFQSFFLEVLEKSIALRLGPNTISIEKELKKVAESGISFVDADDLISDYIDSVRPKSDTAKLRAVPGGP